MRKKLLISASVAVFFVTACSNEKGASGADDSAAGQTSTSEPARDAAQADENGNILLAEWTGPFGGVPAFDK
ncbi:MAG: hypothetical protein AAGJ73_08830, partial [Pseudomonadota bacterium]